MTKDFFDHRSVRRKPRWSFDVGEKRRRLFVGWRSTGSRQKNFRYLDPDQEKSSKVWHAIIA